MSCRDPHFLSFFTIVARAVPKKSPFVNNNFGQRYLIVLPEFLHIYEANTVLLYYTPFSLRLRLRSSLGPEPFFLKKIVLQRDSIMNKELLAESMTIRMTFRDKKRIQNYANKQGISYSEAIRILCNLALETIQTEEENE